MSFAPARVGIVVNRRARHLGGDSAVRRAITEAAAGRGDVELIETHALDALDDVARRLVDAGVTRVVLAGGDGSYMAGVTALARAYGERSLPEITLAPGGTVSTVARNHGAVRGSLATSAARAVHAALDGAGRVVKQPTLRVQGDDRPPHLGFIFGAGLVASFFDVYYASPHQGYAGAARIVARVFAGSLTGGALARRILSPTPCTLRVDGDEAAPRAWSLVAASVVRDLGLHMRLTYRAAEDPDRFHAVASALGPRALGPQMPLVLAGRRLRGRHHVDALARELTVTFPDEGPYVLDGEVLRARVARITAGPAFALRIP